MSTCQPPASVAWVVRVGGVSKKLLFSWHCTLVHSLLQEFWCFSYFCPFLGSESREEWQEDRMNPQTSSLLWTQQSTLSQFTEHLHLVFYKICALLLGEISPPAPHCELQIQ